jgi:hypothetical protein
MLSKDLLGQLMDTVGYNMTESKPTWGNVIAARCQTFARPDSVRRVVFARLVPGG